MDDILDDLVRIARRCERAARAFEDPPLDNIRHRLFDASESAGAAWSGSWIGYHASVYTHGLHARRPGEHFDSHWGAMDRYSNRTSGEWCEYSYEAIHDEILRRADGADPRTIAEAAQVAGKVFDECRQDLLPTFDAVIAAHGDSALKQLREKLEKLRSHISASDFVKTRLPTQVMSLDMRAIQGGLQVPHHLAFEASLMEQLSYGDKVGELAKIARHGAVYLEKRKKMKGKSVAKTEGPIFIGHGRSGEWKDLRDFVVQRLDLKYEEFNREPIAGLSTKERLLEMLDRCSFAFLVMTAEDQRADGTLHARDNVIHEIGLFQGRYGFERAIVLLEDNCQEFSNLHGVGQIRFRPGQIGAVSEEIRQVLKREGIIG